MGKQQVLDQILSDARAEAQMITEEAEVLPEGGLRRLGLFPENAVDIAGVIA